MVIQRQPQDHLIESFDEVTVKQLLLIESFAHYPTDELEQLDVLGLHCRLRVWVIGGAGVGLQEER